MEQQRHDGRRGFTLLELLVVISIIILISAIALPTLNAFKPDPLKAASNQLVNDLSYARRRAIADHTTVYVVFMPPLDHFAKVNLNAGVIPLADQQKMLNSQYRGYAMYEKREIADQPGASTPHWITRWRNLPDGTAIAAEKFGVLLGAPPVVSTVPFNGSTALGYLTFDYISTGPITINPDTNVLNNSYFPTVAFDYRGTLVGTWNGWRPPYDATSAGFDCVIPLTRAHVGVAPFTGNPAVDWTQPATFSENPPGTWTNIYTHVVVDGPTGRARPDRRAVQ